VVANGVVERRNSLSDSCINSTSVNVIKSSLSQHGTGNTHNKITSLTREREWYMALSLCSLMPPMVVTLVDVCSEFGEHYFTHSALVMIDPC